MNRRFSCQGAGCTRSVDFSTQFCIKCERRLDEGGDVDDEVEPDDGPDFEHPHEEDDHNYGQEVDW